MGRSSAEIQYDLERQRNAVEARIQRLNRRVREDAETVKEEAKYDLDHTIGKESKLADKPKTLLAGAAGTGVVLGILSSSVSLPRLGTPGRNGSKPDQRAYGPSPDERQQSRTQRLAGAAGGTVLGSFSARLDEFVAEVWDSFKSGFTGSEDKGQVSSERYSSGLGEATERQLARGERPEGVVATPEGQTSYLSREEISPYTSSHSKLDGDPEEAREILHDAEVEDMAPRENLPAYSGVQGEGLLYPRTPGKQAPYEEDERSERRTGQ
jgi:ElaB/YqjD/DUF883 family membrane-anchored ribosome-binding protein